jgi:hypothetical protein
LPQILEQAVSFFEMLVNIYQTTGCQVGVLLHPPKKAMLIGRIADIVWSGRGRGFVS